MKKYITITAFLTVGTAFANAASIGYNSMTDAQKADVAFAWDFSSGSTDFAYGSVSMGSAQWGSDPFTLTENKTAVVGKDGTCPWSSRVTGVGDSFTLSLDVNSIKNAENWKTVVSLYSNNKTSQFDHSMSLTTNGDGSGTIVLQSGLGDQTAYGSAGNRTLQTGLKATDINDTTFTIVSDAVSQTLTLYVNGKQASQSENWVAGAGTLALTGFQFGSNFSNCDVIENAEISNITVWNKALTAKEVASIIPEPSMFGLLAGIGALALVASRRRRK